MRKPPAMVPGDKNVRLNFYLFLAVYILIIVSAESLIDFVLQIGVDIRDPQSIILMNQNKVDMTNVIITVIHILPMLMVAWLGYRILTSAKLPPARMKLPFTVPLIEGKNARLIGILLIIFSLFLIAQDLVLLAQKFTF
jgi:hypothetical protein